MSDQSFDEWLAENYGPASPPEPDWTMDLIEESLDPVRFFPEDATELEKIIFQALEQGGTWARGAALVAEKIERGQLPHPFKVELQQIRDELRRLDHAVMGSFMPNHREVSRGILDIFRLVDELSAKFNQYLKEKGA